MSSVKSWALDGRLMRNSYKCLGMRVPKVLAVLYSGPPCFSPAILSLDHMHASRPADNSNLEEASSQIKYTVLRNPRP